MTIRKGEEWGHAAPLEEGGQVAASDAEAADIVTRARRLGTPVPPIGLLGGDLWRAMGAPQGGLGRLRGAGARTVPVDLGTVTANGTDHYFVAHAMLRRGWWRGRIVAAMNSEWCGDWRVVPRAHPNDGRLDIVDANPSLGQRWLARRRLVTGDHLPHPDISVRGTTLATFEFQRRVAIYLDGRKAGTTDRVVVAVEPDALIVVV